MIFGRLPLDEAEGGVLAHTLRLARGVVLKKGRTLESGDLVILRAYGHADVMVARLEAGDVAEDEAAARVAGALAGPGIVAGEPFTGRCNLYAAHHGVLDVDRAAVDALNGVDQALTVATRQPNALVEAEEMVATIKVIPFAAAEEAVARCERIALGSGGARPLNVATLRDLAVGLVLTRLPGTHEKVLDRAEDNTRVRVRGLGSRLLAVERCDHRESAVARAIRRLRDLGCDALLLLGASAIVDRHDVIPTAIVDCGGSIHHFGMPVDPGNLILVGSLDGASVVGVPGCARSLKPSGFDWVLRRALAGLPLDTRSITTMGVGGLLDEVGARVQPRAGLTSPPPSRRVVAVVLAAGQSRRMGSANKLVSDVGGRPMVERVVRSLRDSRVGEVTVVTGHDEAAVREALGDYAVRFVHNPDYARGMSSSLRVGVASLDDGVDGALICLGDMPWVRPEHIDAIVEAFEPGQGREIVVPFADRKRGNPILWGSRFFRAMQRLEGDVGARGLLERHRDAVYELALDDEAVLLDIDTPDALAGVQTDRTVG